MNIFIKRLLTTILLCSCGYSVNFENMQRNIEIFEKNNVNFDKNKINEISNAAKNKDSNARFYLGIMYARGEGVSQDYRKARELFEKSAAQGNAEAQCNLAVMYAQGKGVSQDYRKERELFEKSAAQGNMSFSLSVEESSY